MAVMMVAYVAAHWLLAATYGVPFSLMLYAPIWLVMALALGVYAVTRPILPPRWRVAERLALATPLLLLAPAFFSAFTSIKTGIPTIHPYAWDDALARADRAVFGQDAWRALQPVLGHPPITFALSLLYSCWHAALILVFSAVTLSLGGPQLRSQALISLIACWIVLGTWAAIAMSSVGPCFIGPLHLAAVDTFAPQAAYLREANRSLPIFEFAEQQRLLDAASASHPVLASGISAMPSMHVAIALLIALIGWRTGRWAALAASAYLVAVILASVHLGWHYAMDSVVALAGAGAIWIVSGWAARLATPAHAGAGET